MSHDCNTRISNNKCHLWVRTIVKKDWHMLYCTLNYSTTSAMSTHNELRQSTDGRTWLTNWLKPRDWTFPPSCTAERLLRQGRNLRTLRSSELPVCGVESGSYTLWHTRVYIRSLYNDAIYVHKKELALYSIPIATWQPAMPSTYPVIVAPSLKSAQLTCTSRSTTYCASLSSWWPM